MLLQEELNSETFSWNLPAQAERTEIQGNINGYTRQSENTFYRNIMYEVKTESKNSY